MAPYLEGSFAENRESCPYFFNICYAVRIGAFYYPAYLIWYGNLELFFDIVVFYYVYCRIRSNYSYLVHFLLRKVFSRNLHYAFLSNLLAWKVCSYRYHAFHSLKAKDVSYFKSCISWNVFYSVPLLYCRFHHFFFLFVHAYPLASGDAYGIPKLGAIL